MQVPTVDGEFLITDVLLQAWLIRFPTADLRREHPLMCLWLAKNPKKLPRNPIRFIENWLKKVQADAVRNLAEESKRGQVTAERVGAMYNVTARPGESQEQFNRRVIAAAAGRVVRLVA